jgi:hypothetical protein
MAKSKEEREELRKARIIERSAVAAETLIELAEIARDEMEHPDFAGRKSPALDELLAAATNLSLSGALDDVVAIIKAGAEEQGVSRRGSYESISVRLLDKLDPQGIPAGRQAERNTKLALAMAS